jgi:hypothetical protein
MGKNRNGGENDEEVIRAAGDLETSMVKDPTILQSIYTLLPNLEKIQTASDRHRNIFNEVLGGIQRCYGQDHLGPRHSAPGGQT